MGYKSGLVGKYQIKKEGKTLETLEISDANDNKGEMSGTLTVDVDGKTYKLAVNGHYHWFKSEGPPTSIAFWAQKSDAPSSVYEAWAGTTILNDFKTLDMKGVRSIIDPDKVEPLKNLNGPFVRQE
jgi:hypothetical protein